MLSNVKFFIDGLAFHWIGLRRMNGVFRWLDGSSDLSKTPSWNDKNRSDNCVIVWADERISENTPVDQILTASWYKIIHPCSSKNNFICEYGGKKILKTEK